MDQKDAKLLGAVYSLLLEHGAISEERCLGLLNDNFGYRYFSRDVLWAFYQLDCKEGGELWTLPDRMLPVNERNDQNIREANNPRFPII